MKVVIQRSKESTVEVNDIVVGSINYGMVILVGFTYLDTKKNVNQMIEKILKLRIFDDLNGVMNKNILEINGEILSISQFTLYASLKKGNRPSYLDAMNANDANILYNYFNNELSKQVKISKGVFKADMNVNINNDGPITIILEN